MENIAPPLILLWEVKRALENGHSVSLGIEKYLKRNKTETFNYQVERWRLALSNSRVIFDKSELNFRRQYLLELLEAGLNGAGILSQLQSLESELILSCEEEIQDYVSRLPLISLLPLMGLIFPAMMLILVVPLLQLLRFS